VPFKRNKRKIESWHNQQIMHNNKMVEVVAFLDQLERLSICSFGCGKFLFVLCLNTFFKQKHSFDNLKLLFTLSNTVMFLKQSFDSQMMWFFCRSAFFFFHFEYWISFYCLFELIKLTTQMVFAFFFFSWKSFQFFIFMKFKIYISKKKKKILFCFQLRHCII